MDMHSLEYLVKARQQDMEKDFRYIHLARAFPGSKQEKFRKHAKRLGAILFPRRLRNRDHRSSTKETMVICSKPGSGSTECSPCCTN